MAFAYAPLRGDHTFRLLRLLGGEGDVVECELFDANSDYRKLRYEAVSYCWGAKQRKCAIVINGKTLTIRESLHNLMKGLRHPNTQKHRTVWIDAVCIDQQNKTEQGHQVQQMRRIYASAHRVIFWLGDMTSDVKLLMTALDAFNRVVKSFGWHRLDIVQEISWEQVMNTIEKNPFTLDAQGRMRRGLHELLMRPWFRRAWIIQEVANARRGIVQCGRMTIACRTFTLAPLLLEVTPNSHCQNVLDAMPTNRRTTSWWSDDRDLFGIIQKFRYSESTLDRDRIYALRSLCTFRDDKRLLKVDYEQPIYHVINDTISHILVCDRHSLPDSLYSSMGAFLNDLDTMHLRVLIALLKSEDLHGVRSILLRHPSTRISPLMLSHAVAGNVHGFSLCESLLEFCKGQIEISQSIILAACKNEGHGPALIQLLLSSCKGQIDISESTIVAACENRSHGSAVITLLLPYTRNIPPSSSMFIACAQNPRHGGFILSALIKYFQCSKDIVTPELIYTIAVNDRARSKLIHVLSQDLSTNIVINEDVAVAAARKSNDLMSLDSLFESGQLMVTERIVLAATKNLSMGPRILQYLLRKSTPQYFEISDILVATMIDAIDDSSETVSGIMALRVLLAQRNDEISIGDLVLMSILRNREATGILDLFQACQGLLRMSQKDAGVAGPKDEVVAPQNWAVLNKTRTGHAALWWAIQNSQRAFLEVLIKKGADISVHGMYHAIDSMTFFPGRPIESSYANPLYMACRTGNTSIIELLLNNGADITRSPSPLIAAMGKHKVFKFLIDHGAPVNGELLIGAARLGIVESVREALYRRAKQDDLDYALFYALQGNKMTIVQLLLAAGAQTNSRICQSSGDWRTRWKIFEAYSQS